MNEIETQAVDVVLHAKDILLDGWTKGALFKDDDGNPVTIDGNVQSTCLAGAIRIALLGVENKEQVMLCIAEKLEPYMPSGGIYSYNDCDSRTKEEVVELMDTLVYDFKGEHSPAEEEALDNARLAAEAKGL